MADAVRLQSLGMPTELSREVKKQIESGGLTIGTTATTAMAGNRVPTTTIRGGVIQAPSQADSTATDASELVTDFNALLAKLRTAGVIGS